MKRLTYILLAAMALFASCNEVPEPQKENNLSVNINSKTLEATHGSFVLQVESNTDWSVTSSAEWLTPNNKEFSGSAGVLISYTDNTTNKSRSAKISITPQEVGTTATWDILVTQKGTSENNGNDDGGNDGGNDGNDDGGNDDGNDDGGNDDGNDGGNDDGGNDDIVGSGSGDEDDPYNVARIVEILTNGNALPDTPQYVKGIISSIEEVSTTHGNATFYISDSGNTYTTQLLIYRSKYLNGEDFTSTSQISVGDEVVIVGTPILYKGTTPEMSPCSIYSLNGKTSDEGGNDDGGNDDSGDDDGGNTGGIVTDSDAKYAGWAELPAEENNPDYYYAYHMIPDKGNGKVRNFAVCYSEDLGCPVWVASPMHSYYTAKNTSRSDAYAPDPKIPSSIQVHRRDGYTRGHLLGSSDRLVSRGANEQAFYYSNIAPQLQSGFNTGGGVWNNLEEYCDGLLCADTLYMVNGCYWENYNKKSSGTVIPTHYYKVLLRTKKGNSGKWVVNCSASELKCVVFMVEHNSSQHKVEPHKGMMMSVAELERMTGHTFFPNVPNAPKDTYNPSDWGM